MNDLPAHEFDAEVDAKAHELIAEFQKHKDDNIAAYPTRTYADKIFRGWAIQKIAGLQCQVLDLVGRVIALERGKQRKSS